MQIEYLREFVELLNCLNFSKAAKKLYISQPALSNHIAELENELGATLVTREKPIQPTIAGINFYNDASKILQVYDRARSKVRELSAEKGHTIVVKMPHGGSDNKKSFFRLIASFKAHYPFANIHLTSGEQLYLLDELASAHIDCGIIPAIFGVDEIIRDRQLDYQLSSVEPLGVWVDKTSPLSKQTSLQPEQLSKCKYPLPSSAQFEEIKQSALAFFDFYNVTPSYRYVYSDSFEGFLFCIDQDEVLLGVPTARNTTSGALDERLFIPFDPQILHEVYIVTRIDESNPMLTLFSQYIHEYFGDLGFKRPEHDDK